VAQPEPDLNPIQHLWRDLKIAVQRCSSSNLTELVRISRKEWEKLPKYRCGLVAYLVNTVLVGEANHITM
jgi:transposase